jgi:cobalt/nickel transport system permease protein
MHIPDGFLDGKTAGATMMLAAGGLGMALWQAKKNLPPKRVPLMGLCGAFIFAAQMLNFPVAGGTSGHLVGGVLAAVLLGPSAAIVVLTCVLIVQCFLFHDGGLTALGANILNMGIISSVGGYFVYRIVWRLIPNSFGRLAAVAFASWVATVAAAIVCAGELAVSGNVPWAIGFRAMTYVHMLIGVGEALLTTLIIASVLRTRPDLLREPIAAESNDGKGAFAGHLATISFGMLIALALALFVSPLASRWPDGLDRVAENLGFKEKDRTNQPLIPSPIPDYKMPGVKNASMATSLAGGVGTVVAFGLSLLLARGLATKVDSEENPAKT